MLPKTIQRFIEREIDNPIEDVYEIKAGLNNRLFKVATSEEEYLVKLYRSGADIMLEREFCALKYLRTQNILSVPIAYSKNDKQNFAIYSFEEGVSKSPLQLTKEDLNIMASFIASIHKLQPIGIRREFLAANYACFSITDYLKNITFRLNKFLAYAESRSTPMIIGRIKDEKVCSKIESLVHDVLSEFTNDFINRKLRVGEERLSPVDFGVHNILFKRDGSLCFIDFEYFGRDDPTRAVADFLMHDRSLDIKPKLKRYFQNRYLEYVDADEKYQQRLEIVKKIIDIEWLAIYLYSMTPEKIEIRKFSDVSFETDKYLKKQSLKLYSRLKDIENKK